MLDSAGRSATGTSTSPPYVSPRPLRCATTSASATASPCRAWSLGVFTSPMSIPRTERSSRRGFKAALEAGERLALRVPRDLARRRSSTGSRCTARSIAAAMTGAQLGTIASDRPQVGRGGAAQRRPQQGRVPRHARPRAAQSARADPQRARDHAPDARAADPSTARATSSSASCTQMIHLVDDLLDISRITQGKIELRPEPDRHG